MNRIEKKFSDLKKNGGKALIAFFTAGDYGLSATKKLVLEFEQRGVDIIELGVPFSDPVADGPTIQASSERSLKRGTKLKDIISAVGQLRKKTQIPIVLMGYYNPILKFGSPASSRNCVRNGVDGAIIPDLPSRGSRGTDSGGKRQGFRYHIPPKPHKFPEENKDALREDQGFYLLCFPDRDHRGKVFVACRSRRTRKTDQEDLGQAGVCRFRHLKG
jgi:tryptophan synthase alpha chain